MGSALDTATRLSNRVFAIYVVLLIAVAVFTWWTWYLGNRVQSAIQQDANIRIAEANAKAADANARAAEATVKLEQLKEKLGGRQFSAAQSRALSRALKGIRPLSINFAYVAGDSEASHFAQQLGAAFKSLGWRPAYQGNLMYYSNEPTEFMVSVGPNSVVGHTAERLVAALNASGVAAHLDRSSDGLLPDDVQLFVPRDQDLATFLEGSQTKH